MASLTYSSKALDALSLFHKSRYVVYVEGQDDVPFWNKIFRSFGLNNCKIKPAGGAPELDKYIESVISEDVDIIIARDCDYSDLTGSKIEHVRIVYTYGHSIENSLYCPENIAESIAVYSRSDENYVGRVQEWLADFISQFKQLVILEVANALYDRGVEVMGDSCHRYCEPKKAHLPSSRRIAKHISNVLSQFDQEEIDHAERLVNEASKELAFLIRGHFLTGAVAYFIKSEVKRIRGKDVSISLDNLYAQLVGQLESTCLHRDDFIYLKMQIDKIRKQAA